MTTKIEMPEGPRDLAASIEDYLLIFGRNVKAERIRSGWKQGEFEIKYGLGKSTLCSIEKGRRGPSVKTLVLICKAFGLRPDGLLGLPVWTVPEGAPSNGKGLDWVDAIGPRVAFCMKHRDLSPHQLAVITGLSKVTINEIARGESCGSPESMIALCFALNAPLFWLLGFPSFT